MAYSQWTNGDSKNLTINTYLKTLQVGKRALMYKIRLMGQNVTVWYRAFEIDN